MPSADLLFPFFLASLAFACVPGPGMLYAAARTLTLGRRAGWWSALGFHVAGLGHVAAAAAGISALLAAAPALFTVLKLAGAAWLVWLGIGCLRGEAPPVPGSAAATPARAFRDSVLAEILNPKTALFHLAFLPQFTDPAAAFPVWLQIAVLGVVVNALFSVTDAVLIEASHAAAARLRASGRTLRALRRFGGGVLVGLGVHLALARNP